MKLIVKKESVVRLFEKLGFKTAGSWDERRLLQKVKNLPELIEGTKIKLKNTKAKALLKAILKAKEVVFKKEKQPEPATHKTAKKETVDKKKVGNGSKKSKKKVEAKTKKTAPAPKSTVEKDAFGRRLGTQGALIDTKFDKKGKTVEQIAKECKLSTGRISTHVRDFIAKGWLKEDKNGKVTLTGKTK